MKNKIIKIFCDNKLTLITTLILILLIGVSIYFTFAFYTDSSTQNLITGSVGYFENPDLSINFMVEDRNEEGYGTGTYTAYWVAPSYNYEYNASSSECTNGASFEKTEEDNFTVTSSGKTKCYFYYDAIDLNGAADVQIIVMREAVGAEGADVNGYIVASNYSTTGLGNEGYLYNSELTQCTNGASVSYDYTTNTINVSSTASTVCKVYFYKES